MTKPQPSKLARCRVCGNLPMSGRFMLWGIGQSKYRYWMNCDCVDGDDITHDVTAYGRTREQANERWNKWNAPSK